MMETRDYGKRALLAFFLIVICVSAVVETLICRGGSEWLYLVESSSVWPAAFLHAAHNNYDQAVFGIITRGDNRMYFVSETGVLTILCAWILAIGLFLSYRRKHTCKSDTIR